MQTPRGATSAPRTKEEELAMIELAQQMSLAEARQQGLPLDNVSQPERRSLPMQRSLAIHQAAFAHLLQDCQTLSDKAHQATSYRELCRKLGARAEEIKGVAEVAAVHVFSEEALWFFLKAVSNAHNLVSQGIALIDVHGMYSRAKKYMKHVFNASASHRDKLQAHLEKLDGVHEDFWEMAEQFAREQIPKPPPGRRPELQSAEPQGSGGDLDLLRQPSLERVSSPHLSDESAPATALGAPRRTGSFSGNRKFSRTVSGRIYDSTLQPLLRLPSPAARKLQIGNWLMPKPATSLLYLDNGTADNDGVIWWWCNNAMHEHDIQGMTTKRFEAGKQRDKWAAVKVLAYDLSWLYVWAGHEDGTVSLWEESTGFTLMTASEDLARALREVRSIEPLAPFKVAVGGESGQVFLLRLEGYLRSGMEVRDEQGAQANPSDKALSINVVNMLIANRKVAAAGKVLALPSSESPCLPPFQKRGHRTQNFIRNLSTAFSATSRRHTRSNSDVNAASANTSSSLPQAAPSYELKEDQSSVKAGRDVSPLPHPQDMPAHDGPSNNPLESESSFMSNRSGGGGLSAHMPSTAGAERASNRRSSDNDDNIVAAVVNTLTSGIEAVRKQAAHALQYKSWEAPSGSADRPIAHEGAVVAMLCKGRFIFTSSVSGFCDAQIRAWVEVGQAESMQYELLDTYHCMRNRAASSMTTIPWASAACAASNSAGTSSKCWRLLTGHESGNILMFDPSQTNLKPVLSISFARPQAIKHIALMRPFGLLAITRADGTMHMINCFTPDSKIMNNALDSSKPVHLQNFHQLKKDDVELGKVQLHDDTDGWILQLHDHKAELVSVAPNKGGVASGSGRGTIVFWPPSFIEVNAREKGLTLSRLEKSMELVPTGSMDTTNDATTNAGSAVDESTKGALSVNLEDDEDLDLVDASDIVVGKFLGDGGFGTVCEGSLHHTRVAVKVIKQQQVQGILGTAIHASRQGTLTSENQDIRRDLAREVRILKKVRHPNVVFFRALCLHPPMIVTELCEHGSLYQVIKNYHKQRSAYKSRREIVWCDKLTWLVRVNLACDAAKGMAYLHQRKLLHCDLKSLNLLVHGTDLVCKVADFGLSRYLTGKESKGTTPAANNPMWQAPEVIRDPTASSKAGDVYAFGIIMWELLMMTAPWGDMQRYPVLIINAVQEGERPEVPSDRTKIPGSNGREPLPRVEDYITLIQECWAQEPEERPDFDEVVQRLEDIVTGIAGSDSAKETQTQNLNVVEASEAPRVIVQPDIPRVLRHTISLPNNQSLPPPESLSLGPEDSGAGLQGGRAFRGQPPLPFNAPPPTIPELPPRARQYGTDGPLRRPPLASASPVEAYARRPVELRAVEPAATRRFQHSRQATDPFTEPGASSLPHTSVDDSEVDYTYGSVSDGEERLSSTRRVNSFPEFQLPAHLRETRQHGDASTSPLAPPGGLWGRLTDDPSNGGANVPSLTRVGPSSFSVEPLAAHLPSMTGTGSEVRGQVPPGIASLAAVVRQGSIRSVGERGSAMQPLMPPTPDKAESIVFLNSKVAPRPVTYAHSQIFNAAPTLDESAGVNVMRPAADAARAPAPASLGLRSDDSLAARSLSPYGSDAGRQPARSRLHPDTGRAAGRPAQSRPPRSDADGPAMAPVLESPFVAPPGASSRPTPPPPAANGASQPSVPMLASPFDVEPTQHNGGNGDDAQAPALASAFDREPLAASQDLSHGVRVRSHDADPPAPAPTDPKAPELRSPFDWEPSGAVSSSLSVPPPGLGAPAPHANGELGALGFVAPSLMSAFDAEPPSASGDLLQASHPPSSLKLQSSFDIEPPSARRQHELSTPTMRSPARPHATQQPPVAAVPLTDAFPGAVQPRSRAAPTQRSTPYPVLVYRNAPAAGAPVAESTVVMNWGRDRLSTSMQSSRDNDSTPTSTGLTPLTPTDANWPAAAPTLPPHASPFDVEPWSASADLRAAEALGNAPAAVARPDASPFDLEPMAASVRMVPLLHWDTARASLASSASLDNELPAPAPKGRKSGAPTTLPFVGEANAPPGEKGTDPAGASAASPGGAGRWESAFDSEPPAASPGEASTRAAHSSSAGGATGQAAPAALAPSAVSGSRPFAEVLPAGGPPLVRQTPDETPAAVKVARPSPPSGAYALGGVTAWTSQPEVAQRSHDGRHTVTDESVSVSDGKDPAAKASAYAGLPGIAEGADYATQSRSLHLTAALSSAAPHSQPLVDSRASGASAGPHWNSLPDLSSAFDAEPMAAVIK